MIETLHSSTSSATSPDPALASAASARSSARDKWIFAFVLCTWLACAVLAHGYIVSFAPRMPIADDNALFDVAYGEPGAPSLASWAWSLHNEHRLPLPKLVQLALYRATGDIRSGMHLECAIYAVTALACILAARRLRAGSHPGSRAWDAFFPLAFLQVGNSENLLLGFQICIALAVACACAILLLSVLSPRRSWPSRAIGSALALAALPSCGAVGLLYVPALAAWMAWLGIRHRRSADHGERVASWIYLAAAIVAVASSVAYVVGFERPSHLHYDHGGWSLVRAFLGFATVAFGPAHASAWPASGWVVAIGLAVATLLFARRAIVSRGADERAVGVAMMLAACLSLAVGISVGRPPGPALSFPNRYVPLPLPLYVTMALGALASWRSRAREAPLVAFCAAMIAALPASIEFAERFGEARAADAAAIEALVIERAGSQRIAEEYQTRFVPWLPREVPLELLAGWAARELPPFDRSAESAAAFRATLSPAASPR